LRTNWSRGSRWRRAYNAIARCEEREDVGHKVTLVSCQLIGPVLDVGLQVHLLGRPERRFSLLVHLPDLQGGEGDSHVNGAYRCPGNYLTPTEAQTSAQLKACNQIWRQNHCENSCTTDLVVVDREQDKSPRVLLKEFFVIIVVHNLGERRCLLLGRRNLRAKCHRRNGILWRQGANTGRH
jgi:hypothetical protein